jgi:outer membrane protein assembly factor BamB
MALAENWPGFRGPTGFGISADANLPIEWNAKTGKNIRWSSPVEGQGAANPIVWRDRVYVVNVGPNPDGGTPLHQVHAFDADTGKRIWKTVVEPGPFKRGELKGGRGAGYANCTPCTDGERVYALFGSSVLVAVDAAGQQVWRQELKPHNYNFEMANSPVLHGDLVIVFCGMTKDPRLIAFKKATGEVAYDHRLKDTGYCHSTPVFAQVKGQTHMLIAASSKEAAPNALQAFDPATGKRLWWVAGVASTATPVVVGPHVYFDSGRGGTATFAELGSEGDETKSRIKWTTNVTESLSSPIVVGERIYRVHGGGVIVCRSLKDGSKIYQERSPASSAWASPIADAKGRIFFASGGRSAVIQAGDEFKLLAANDLGDGGHAGPAASNGRLFIVGDTKLWCIAQSPGESQEQ